jgi:hypothetical protein
MWRVFTARYALSPYIKQIRFVCKGLNCSSNEQYGHKVSSLDGSLYWIYHAYVSSQQWNTIFYEFNEDVNISDYMASNKGWLWKTLKESSLLNQYLISITANFISGFFFFLVLPSSTYLFTAGVEGFVFCNFHLITLKHTQQSVGLLWTRDRPIAETSTWQHKHCTRDKYPCPRWDSNPLSQQALGRRPRDHWDRPPVFKLFISFCAIHILFYGN